MGDKSNSGRKAAHVPNGEYCQRTVLTLPSSIVLFFKELGGGNTSEGVRKGAQMLRECQTTKAEKFGF